MGRPSSPAFSSLRHGREENHIQVRFSSTRENQARETGEDREIHEAGKTGEVCEADKDREIRDTRESGQSGQTGQARKTGSGQACHFGAAITVREKSECDGGHEEVGSSSETSACGQSIPGCRQGGRR
jgi:hypothetical protein